MGVGAAFLGSKGDGASDHSPPSGVEVTDTTYSPHALMAQGRISFLSKQL